MPELPDITIYVEQLATRLAGASLLASTIASPNLSRTVEPPVESLIGGRVVGVERLGKRIVIEFERERFFVLHLMIAGRLHWVAAGPTGLPGTTGAPGTPGAAGARGGITTPGMRGKSFQARFGFSSGTLLLTEAGAKKRASLYIIAGRAGLAALDAGGVDPLRASKESFGETLARENHTLKRALTDPRLFSGIGNAYSDEILHAARLSPTQLTKNLSDEEIDCLRAATVRVLEEWTERLRTRTGAEFPKKVTAFHPEMAVHGKYRRPCPVCGSPVQRIVRGDHETNYCPTCQTGGRLLADRALSRLLKADWPKTLEEMEELRGRS